MQILYIFIYFQQYINPSDRVLVDEIKELGGYTNVNANGKTEVSTGDFITTNGTEEHKNVVVYGDVDGSGEVNLEDVIYASDIQGNMTQSHPGHTEINTEAADVQNNGEITLEDVIAISDFYGNTNLDYVKDVPEASKTPEVKQEVNFSVNEGIVNDTNADKSTVTLEIADKTNVTEDTKFELYYVDDKGNEHKLDDVTNLTIPKYSNKADIEGVDLSELVGDTVVAKNAEQKFTLKLKRTAPKPEEVVGTAEVTVNRIHPEAVRISAERAGTYGAKLKFEAKAGSDIVKVHYLINEAQKDTVKDNKKFIDPKQTAGVKSMSVENNAFDKELEWDHLANNTVYYVHFVVENAAGNLSEVVTDFTYDATVPSDSATQEGMVTDVKIDDDLKVTFTEPTSAPTGGYTIRIYDENGKVVDEVSASTGDGTTGVDISGKIPKSGKYTFTVSSNGNANGSTKPSDETEPVEFEVSQLAAVTGLHFEIDDETSKVYLKWDEYTEKDKDEFTGYTINISEYDPATKSYKDTTMNKDGIDKDSTEIECSSANTLDITNATNANKRYKAEIVAKGSGKVVKSEPTSTAKDYCNIKIDWKTDECKGVTDKEIDLTLNDPTQISAINTLGDKVTYDLEIHSKVSDGSHISWQCIDTIKNVEFKDGKTIVVDNLPKAPDGYKFVLVAHVDGDKAEGKTTQTNVIKTKVAIPSLEGKVVVSKDNTTGVADAKDKTKGKGKVYSDGTSELYIDGEQIDLAGTTDYYDPNKLLASAAKKDEGFAVVLVSSLADGDTIVSVTEEKVTIKSRNEATKGTDARVIKTVKDAATEVTKTRVVELQGNENLQEINSKSTDVKEIILSGEKTNKGPIFKIKSTNTAPIKLSDGVKIENGTEKASATVLANATATVNDIDISSSGDLIFDETDTGSGNTLNISPAGDQTINISNHSGEELTVTFMNGAQIGDTQVGAIVIDSNADVIVKAGTAGTTPVESPIEVSTENGNITIEDEGLKGEKTIKVSTTEENTTAKVIKARTKLEAPKAIYTPTNPIEIQTYSESALKELRDSGKARDTVGGKNGITYEFVTGMTDEQIIALVAYFEAFGSELKGKGVTVATEADPTNKKVTITLPKGKDLTISSATIGGLE